MNLDFNDVLTIEYNGKTVIDIYVNNNKVWPVVKPPEPFYVENITNENETLHITKSNSSAPTLTIEYSTDNSTWQTLGTTSTTALTRTVAPGEKVYLRCSAKAWGTSSNYNRIRGVSKVGGNAMSLLYGSNFTGQEASFPGRSTYSFRGLFYGNTILADVSELLLPATTLSTYCYREMFNGCTSLTSAPTLPATTLATSCYNSMFGGCTSLTSAPTLPATTLASSCYNSMFDGCTRLISAPALPATTLAGSCYNSMFGGCTSLTSAPTLPATTLSPACYSSMFRGCTSLTAAPALPATTLAGNCYQGMFGGCTSLTSAPALPATTLANFCYHSMFQGCTSLTSTPILPATTLLTYCYYSMFQNCTSLNNVTCLATSNIDNINSTTNWLSGVSSTGTFTKAAGVYWVLGNNGIPYGWTVQDI